jgi:uncharacterized protein (DUF488 family)
MTVWTIGHSTHGFDDFERLLSGHGITRLVDVRTVPASRRLPQFVAAALAAALAPRGIDYVHLGGLGGLRRPLPESVNGAWQNAGFRGFADHMASDAFAAALDELMRMADAQRTAIMCAEALWWRCHRRLIADALTVSGVEVRHIGSDGRTQVHELTPFARVDGSRLWYPGVLEAAH